MYISGIESQSFLITKHTYLRNTKNKYKQPELAQIQKKMAETVAKSIPTKHIQSSLTRMT
jgi:hypothetical protein